MKKSLLTLVALVATVLAFTQNVPRNMVILEIATGTWCQWCPGASNAADQLVSEGKSVAVIENHDADSFSNTGSDSRNTYYGISGYPTAKFDGTVSYVGGALCPSGTVYSNYLPLYNQEINTPSPIKICLSGSSVGNNYTINVVLTKVGTVSGSDLRLHLVVTESHIPFSWQGCETECNYVNRLMVPTPAGTSFSFGSGNVQNFNLNFTKDASWVTTNCSVIAFVQDYPSKTVYNGCQSNLSTLPSSMLALTDFTGTPTTGCTPLNVNFNAAGTGITTYAWTFPGGNPGTSTASTPAITYDNGGAYNVSLVVTNGVCKDSLGKNNYINPTQGAGQATQPVGNTGMCINPPDQTYTTSSLPSATSYTWDLQPPSAGVLTPNGTSCTVNFDNAYSGTAALKVRGSNSCGDGPWSPQLDITVYATPGTPGTPSGPASVCENTQTTYSTTGTSPVTGYTWEVIPTAAGTLSPSGTTVTVTWSVSFSGTAELHVKGINGTCEGPWSNNLDITVNTIPSPFNVTGGGTYCAVGGTGLAVGLDGSQLGVNYTLYLDGVATGSPVAGTGSPITFGNQMAAGIYSVIGENPTTTCNNTMYGQANIYIDPQAPGIPGTPTGPGTTTAGNTDDYTTTGATYASSYSWTVTPGNAGTFSGNGLTGTILWNVSYSGSATVNVQGFNTCGGGNFSVDVPVNVLPATGIPEAGKPQQISLYPNPADGFINLVPVRNMKVNVKVLNTVGSVVLYLENLELNGTYRINTGSLTPGVYFFNITGSDLQEIQKVVIR
ncbi:MAG TPA: Omp28-related outer membrane protein [Bacteroidales bacterium]|nr:Omp28-related outer membrane protein [Bacteroidales bacterium]